MVSLVECVEQGRCPLKAFIFFYMKRKGKLIEEIIARNNLEESIRHVLRGIKRKTCKTGKQILGNKESVIQELQKIISSGEFEISNYREQVIKERNKTRIIQVTPLMERIALNAIMKVVEKYINKTFIRTTAASIKGRGTHYLYHIIKKDMIKDPEGTRYVYKCDIKKFYESIDQDLMIEVLKRYIKDKTVLKILEKCIRALPKGLSIGFRSSQVLGNLFLSHYLDHYLKDKLRVKYYYRYCDDIVILASSYKELTFLKNEVHKRMNMCKLTIKSNEQMWDIRKRDLDFLGFRIFYTGKTQIRKHIKKTFAKKWNRTTDLTRKMQLLGSFYGISKHVNFRNMFKKIIGKSFSNKKKLKSYIYSKKKR